MKNITFSIHVLLKFTPFNQIHENLLMERLIEGVEEWFGKFWI